MHLDTASASHNYMVVDRLSEKLTALGHPTRRSILDRLAEGPASVGVLAEPFDVSQQAISKHLAILERARLIEKRREGRRHVCTLMSRPLRDVADWVVSRLAWEESFDRLDEHLRLNERSREDEQP